MPVPKPRPSRPTRPGQPLRELLLAVQVLDDVDLEITDRALRLPGGHLVGWKHVRAEARGRSAGSEGDRRHMADWLELVRRLAAIRSARALPRLTRPVGLPRGHLLHPGTGWVREAVMGDALDLGIGVLGLRPDFPDRVEIVPLTAWGAIRRDPVLYWLRCRQRLEDMGALAARRWELSTDGQLRPMGGCDALTLLGSAMLRQRLAGTDGGMRAVVVPMRSRGWTRLSRLDPAFAPAAAMATDPVERGFLRPLLVTADEVVLAGAGSRIDISVADPVVERWDAHFSRL